MFSILSHKNRTPKSRSHHCTGFRPQCEALEDRLVMASLAGAIGSVARIPNPFSSLPPAQAVNLITEPRDLIAG
jgi:hypothetical protein